MAGLPCQAVSAGVRAEDGSRVLDQLLQEEGVPREPDSHRTHMEHSKVDGCRDVYKRVVFLSPLPATLRRHVNSSLRPPTLSTPDL